MTERFFIAILRVLLIKSFDIAYIIFTVGILLIAVNNF